MLLLRKILCVMFIFISTSAMADVFVIKNIRVNGLQRIKLGTVLSYLPVREGDKIDSSETTDIIRDLYQTGFFSDVSLKREGNALIISVAERSVIGSINISGNSKLAKKDIDAALRDVGIYEGHALDPYVLNSMQQAIVQQYHNLGFYYAQVNIDVKPEARNRSAVSINIKEGAKAKIKSIRIVGNKTFPEKTLLKQFSLKRTSLFSFFSDSDQYSKEKLDADLEQLRSYYMDRGYLNIEVDSTKVSISPDRKGIYIVVNITEGPVYKFSGFQAAGNFIGKRVEILNLIDIKAGDVFSRKSIMESQEAIIEFLGEYGYGMPNIKVDPDINKKTRRVFINFKIDPGHRVYVRHITFEGNYKTHDEVLRREMRLQEGSVFSMSKINESRRRLLNLGYLQDVEHKITPAMESNNQMDLLYNVKETSAITANLQAGYSDYDGFLYGASLSDQNVFGTGKSASISFDNSKSTQYYSIGYRDPYFTTDGIGFAFNAYLSKSDPSKIDLSSYTTDIYGVLASFDAPISEYSKLSLGFGVEHIKLGESAVSSDQVKGFISTYGRIFNQFKIVASWLYSNVDRALFPTRGFASTLAVEGYGPLDTKSLEYYKASYNATLYQPLFKGFIVRAHTALGYGDGIGRSNDLPFYKNYFAGGIGSVRGFEGGTLSDKKDSNGKSLGGNVLTVVNLGLIIPFPMKDILRPSIFIDVGNTYKNCCKLQDLRASYGIQLEWRTPLAPIVFSLAKPLRSRSGDELESFQFSLSASI